MSVTIIVMVTNGFTHYMTAEIEKLGARTIVIFYDPGRAMRGESVGAIGELSNEDVTYLRERVDSIEIFSPILQVPAEKVVYGEKYVNGPRVYATDERQIELSKIAMLSGRSLTAADVENSTNVCLIGEEIRDTLFPNTEPVGKFVTFQGITLEVVGVMDAIELLGQSSGKDVWVPITTAQAKWVGGDSVSFIAGLPKDGVEVKDAMQEVWEVLMAKSNNKAVYRVDSRESIITTFSAILGTIGVVLGAVAALALLVGGIGIMNIMLVSVTERTREIGLRKAVGAKKNVIVTQFLVEAAMLSLVGGLIGMAVAYGMGSLVTVLTKGMQWPNDEGLLTPFPIFAAVLASAFSALIGVVFGLYPAARAAQLSPIEALRTE
jgi:putative ABC transport system permease protein